MLGESGEDAGETPGDSTPASNGDTTQFPWWQLAAGVAALGGGAGAMLLVVVMRREKSRRW